VPPAYDLHQHLYPERFLSVLSHRREPPRLRGRRLELSTEPGGEIDPADHALDRRLALLDRDGIDVAVISLAPTMSTDGADDLRAAYHDGILELVAASNGRLLALAAGECRDGFVGACISAQALSTDVEPLLAELEASGQILFVHPGPPTPFAVGRPGWWPALADYTAQMQTAYLGWLARDGAPRPRLPVVFSMLAGGGPVQLERLRSRGVDLRTVLHPNVYFEASSYGRRALELTLATFGVTQLVYGSDAPVIDPRATLSEVTAFGEAVERLVLRENPHRLLAAVS
jgi:predicted TIM-barrel fold metal-dependent hydrolase